MCAISRYSKDVPGGPWKKAAKSIFMHTIFQMNVYASVMHTQF